MGEGKSGQDQSARRDFPKGNAVWSAAGSAMRESEQQSEPQGSSLRSTDAGLERTPIRAKTCATRMSGSHGGTQSGRELGSEE
eukprot:681581-Pleurochrysis_carterae.AAC.1